MSRHYVNEEACIGKQSLNSWVGLEAQSNLTLAKAAC